MVLPGFTNTEDSAWMTAVAARERERERGWERSKETKTYGECWARSRGLSWAPCWPDTRSDLCLSFWISDGQCGSCLLLLIKYHLARSILRTQSSVAGGLLTDTLQQYRILHSTTMFYNCPTLPSIAGEGDGPAGENHGVNSSPYPGDSSLPPAPHSADQSRCLSLHTWAQRSEVRGQRSGVRGQRSVGSPEMFLLLWGTARSK